jgi:hypothetical protein
MHQDNQTQTLIRVGGLVLANFKLLKDRKPENSPFLWMFIRRDDMLRPSGLYSAI